MKIISIRLICLIIFTFFLAACSFTKPRTTADFDIDYNKHLIKPDSNKLTKNIPELISYKELADNNKNNKDKLALYSVMVHNAPVRETLLGLAKSAKVNIDIHPNVDGNITLNAIQETMPSILDRICEQLDIRWSKKNNHILVELDTPYLKNYMVDYINMGRDLEAKVSTNTQIVTQSQINTNPNASGNNNTATNIEVNGASIDNNSNVSSTLVKNKAYNNFWRTLRKNIKDILNETNKTSSDVSNEIKVKNESNKLIKQLTETSKSIANSLKDLDKLNVLNDFNNLDLFYSHRNDESDSSVIINQETGIISVRATHKQHQKINDFIQQVFNSAKRQVLIEATIIEVILNDNYQQGIDWKKITGFGAFSFIGNSLNNNNINLSYINDNDKTILVNLLETFGETKVLSSPHLAVLNNQTAMLKVVENYVYFNVKADTISMANVGTTTTYTSTPQTVSVGVVMSVTPQISKDNIVMLNVRPTITQIAYTVADPNPDLQKNGIQNLLPVIDTREIESVLRIKSGQTAILGGLMKDEVNLKRSAVPILGNIPLLGEVFNNFNHSKKKSELIILLRPLVIKENQL